MTFVSHLSGLRISDRSENIGLQVGKNHNGNVELPDRNTRGCFLEEILPKFST